MKKEWIFASGVGLFTLILALAILRWMAPQLLGIPTDLQMVQVSTEVPPFFEGVFRKEDYQNHGFIIPDPYTKRAKPLYPEVAGTGPHDILGFRNRVIPHSADIIAIGDSQTYGNNVLLEENWPSQLVIHLNQPHLKLYSMAVGGWGAIEFLEIFPKALHFNPRIVLVAFYTGNDPLESFRLAYASDRWSNLRPDPTLAEKDMPHGIFPPPEDEWWKVDFSDGVTTIFTSALRLGSNNDHPAVHAGYQIMAEVGRRLGEMAREQQIFLVFTVIPTKELVYEKKVNREELNPPPDYLALIQAEKENLSNLVEQLQKVSGAVYVDVLEPLQNAALTMTNIYPRNINGHPLALGYAVIAKAMTQDIEKVLWPVPANRAKAHLKFRAAFALQKGGRQGDAILGYQEALKLDPTHTQAALNLAYALINQSQTDLPQAIELLEGLAQRRPDYTEVFYRLGEAHRLHGETEKAAEWYLRYVKVGNHRSLLQQAKQRLGTMETNKPSPPTSR